MKTKPPFRADHVGSLIRPVELVSARVAWNEGKLSGEELKALEDQSIRDAIALQEEAGLQSVTDGEMRRESWRDVFFESVDGFSHVLEDGLSFTFKMAPGQTFKSRPVPTVAGKLSRRKPLASSDFAFLKASTKVTPKTTLPSPSVNHFFRGDEMFAKSPYHDRKSYFADIARIYREEIAELAEKGCRYLQIDDVVSALMCDPTKTEAIRTREDPDRLFDDYIDLFNEAVRDRHPEMIVCVHLCRGNMGKGVASGGYEPIAEKFFNRLDVDGFFLEFDDERSGGFEPLRFVPKGRSVVLGLVSSKLPALEPVDELRRRVDEASRHIELDALCLSPQCGFSSNYNTFSLTMDDERRKLQHVVSVARKIWG